MSNETNEVGSATAAKPDAKPNKMEEFRLGVKPIDDTVGKIDAGVRRISKKIHEVIDKDK